VKELFDGGAQVGVAGTAFVQEGRASLRLQVDRLVEQRFHV
jgi:hypothetical protein